MKFDITLVSVAVALLGLCGTTAHARAHANCEETAMYTMQLAEARDKGLPLEKVLTIVHDTQFSDATAAQRLAGRHVAIVIYAHPELNPTQIYEQALQACQD